MGWFSTDVARLKIVMDLPLDTGRGRAALTWNQFLEVPGLSAAQLTIAAAVLTYARALFVTDDKNRPELFSRVNDAALALRKTGVLALDTWSLKAVGSEFWIWPWATDPVQDPIRGKTYTATLKTTRSGSLFITLKVPPFLDRVLVPSAALIALHVVSESLEDEDLVRLATTLLAVNQYFGHADAANAVGVDAKAFASALPHLLQ